jgi:hypothetical protein
LRAVDFTTRNGTVAAASAKYGIAVSPAGNAATPYAVNPSSVIVAQRPSLPSMKL